MLYLQMESLRNLYIKKPFQSLSVESEDGESASVAIWLIFLFVWPYYNNKKILKLCVYNIYYIYIIFFVNSKVTPVKKTTKVVEIEKNFFIQNSSFSICVKELFNDFSRFKVLLRWQTSQVDNWINNFI